MAVGTVSKVKVFSLHWLREIREKKEQKKKRKEGKIGQNTKGKKKRKKGQEEVVSPSMRDSDDHDRANEKKIVWRGTSHQLKGKYYFQYKYTPGSL